MVIPRFIGLKAREFILNHISLLRLMIIRHLLRQPRSRVTRQQPTRGKWWSFENLATLPNSIDNIANNTLSVQPARSCVRCGL